PAETPSTSSTRASGRHAESTHQTPLLNGQTLPAAALALNAGALTGVAFVHWLIGQSLYELNKLCPYCAVVWLATIALFWYVTLHCLEQGIVPVPRGVLEVVRDTHWMLLAAWYGVIALLALTRFWPYWSSLL
ncbi:vitamin K epoxide reductase family protein, partial [Streptomyces sp. NPDC006265]|uniref:vitamin K epoxide reductase family protein n=1 Tax=Streptomyces sp. NPDC006265 TaxID=3156740 RepID=UPI0033AE503C